MVWREGGDMKSILIVGYGVVGSLLANEISVLKPDIYDKYKEPYNDRSKLKEHYDVAFICVDTPFTPASFCDIGEVKNAICENNADIYVIKSTVLPGTSERLSRELSKSIVFSPEYYGGTQHCNNFDFDFTVLGGTRIDCIEIQQMLQDVYDARHKFKLTDHTTAELLKYMVNTHLGIIVSFCVQFYELAENYGVDYEELRELFLLDPRTNPAHTYVYRDHPYWESHCLSKDIPAIAYDGEARFLLDLIEYNKYCKENL